MSTVPQKKKEKYQGDIVDSRVNDLLRDQGDFIPPHQRDNYIPPKDQNNTGRELKSQQRAGSAKVDLKNIESLAKTATTGQVGLIKQTLKFAYSLWKQIDLLRDWPYVFILIPMSALKDIFDIAFAAIPGVGIIVSFTFTVLIAIMTAVFLVLITGKYTSKRAILTITGPLIQMLTEALPGIGWLPLCFIETVLIYLIVLGQRALATEFGQTGEGQSEGDEEQRNEPAQTEPQAA